MRGQRLVTLGLLLALFALLTPLGIYMLRSGGLVSLMWAFGIWAILVGVAGVSNWREARRNQNRRRARVEAAAGTGAGAEAGAGTDPDSGTDVAPPVDSPHPDDNPGGEGR